MNETAERQIKNILVALDRAEDSQSLCEYGVRLAELLQASLEGMFIEDSSLLDLAGFPFAREIVPGRSTARTITSISMERTLKSQREQAQKIFTTVSSQKNIQGRFRAVRGEVITELMTACEQNDVIVVNRRSNYLSAGLSEVGNVAVLFNSAPESINALKIAANLMAEDSSQLLLVLNTGNDRTRAEQMVLEALKDKKIKTHLIQMNDIDQEEMLETMRKQNATVLVLNADHAEAGKLSLRDLLMKSNFSIVLLR